MSAPCRIAQLRSPFRSAPLPMEAMTYVCAKLIDSGAEDYMLETAMLKVFATEHLWTIVNDTIQTYGGAAYFCDEPFERMMRDARINMIGEGANDVLRVFVALVGMRDVGLELKGILDAINSPFQNLGRLGSFTARRLGGLFSRPTYQPRNNQLAEDGEALGGLVSRFASQIEKLLRTYRESVMDRQYQLGRIADAAHDRYLRSVIHWNMADLHEAAGELERALAERDAEIELLTVIGNDRNLAGAEAHRARLLNRLGRVAEARSAAVRAREAAARTGDEGLAKLIETELPATPRGKDSGRAGS